MDAKQKNILRKADFCDIYAKSLYLNESEIKRERDGVRARGKYGIFHHQMIFVLRWMETVEMIAFVRIKNAFFVISSSIHIEDWIKNFYSMCGVIQVKLTLVNWSWH